MAFDAEDHCFPLAGNHDSLPCLFSHHIFQFPYVVDFEEASFFTAEFTDIGLQPLGQRGPPLEYPRIW